MELSSLHLLLTYQCTLECDHCFVWGSPQQTGNLSLAKIQDILRQAHELPEIQSVYFEGGEPFLYYATLLAAVRLAHQQGFQVGIVSNGYWATSPEDALEALRPFEGLVQDLSISSDVYHWNAAQSQQAEHIRVAAKELDIPLSIISIAQPAGGQAVSGQLPPGESAVMYRGRAAATLASRALQRPWQTFDCCPHENLRDPGRVHVDPFGNVHLCQGLAIGNLFDKPLSELCANFEPDGHPIIGPLLVGGPAELVRRYELAHEENYADACHLCDDTRHQLRARFPDVLGPDQMYYDAGQTRRRAEQ